VTHFCCSSWTIFITWITFGRLALLEAWYSALCFFHLSVQRVKYDWNLRKKSVGHGLYAFSRSVHFWSATHDWKLLNRSNELWKLPSAYIRFTPEDNAVWIKKTVVCWRTGQVMLCLKYLVLPLLFICSSVWNSLPDVFTSAPTLAISQTSENPEVDGTFAAVPSLFSVPFKLTHRAWWLSSF